MEKSISPNFQLKESLTSLFLSPRCLYKRVFVFDHFVFILRADRGVDRGGSMVATSYSRFLTSGVSDTSESLSHFAESTLLSHDIVSDDFSWSSSNLIIRLYFLVGVRHRHRCERAFSEDTKEALNSSCIFKVLSFAHSNHIFRRSLQISPQTIHCTFLFTMFKPALNHSVAVSSSQRVKISQFQTGTPLICRRPSCDSVEPNDIDKSLPRGSATMYDTSMNTAMSV